MCLLKTRNLSMHFGGLIAVDRLSMQVEKGQIVSIIGPNGAGKTTVFNIISGFYQPTLGEVVFHDARIDGKSPDQIAKLGISRTFQTIRLYRNLTVFDNVLAAQHLRVSGNLLSTVFHLPKCVNEERAMRERAELLLEESGLSASAEQKASSLSYGLQRRLEIVRALATRPKLIMLDEPAAGMNPKETGDLSCFIQAIRDTYGISVLLIEHHMGFVMGISDAVYVLDFGRTIACGAPTEVQKDPAVIKAYLGSRGRQRCLS